MSARLFIAHSEAKKLTETGQGAPHHPPPPAQATPMLGATDGQQRYDMPCLQPAPNRGRVVPTIPEHSPGAVWVARVRRAAGESRPPTPRLLASRSDSHRLGEPRAARRARRRSDGACSRAWPDRWDWTGLVTTVHRADGTTVHDRPRPINLVVACEPIQEHEVEEIPYPRQSPIAQAPSTRHPRPTRVPAEASATEHRCAGRRQCR